MTGTYTSEFRIVHVGHNRYKVAEVIPVSENGEARYYCLRLFFPDWITLQSYVPCTNGVEDILEITDLVK